MEIAVKITASLCVRARCRNGESAHRLFFYSSLTTQPITLSGHLLQIAVDKDYFLFIYPQSRGGLQKWRTEKMRRRNSSAANARVSQQNVFLHHDKCDTILHKFTD